MQNVKQTYLHTLFLDFHIFIMQESNTIIK